MNSSDALQQNYQNRLDRLQCAKYRTVVHRPQAPSVGS